MKLRPKKPYDVLVRTTGEWSGTVEATCLGAAREMARLDFNEGWLAQCEEGIVGIDATESVPAPQRSGDDNQLPLVAAVAAKKSQV